jgi:predicted  nucleic acid-binding Zn-ribbon protein
MRKLIVDGESMYFVSSNASDMYYDSKKGEVKLGDYITLLENRTVELENRTVELENKVKELENKLANFGNDVEETIKSIIKSYVVGTDKEIKVEENKNVLRIGFADDAIFGNIN